METVITRMVLPPGGWMRAGPAPTADKPEHVCKDDYS